MGNGVRMTRLFSSLLRARHLAVLALLAAMALPSAAQAADPVRYKGYYDAFTRGRALIPGHDSRWVPQGLAYWQEQDAMVISYYDSEKVLNSRLAVIDRKTSAFKKYVNLPQKSHVGGLAFAHGYLWIAGSNAITRLGKRKLAATPNGGTTPTGKTFPTKASAWVTIVGRTLYAGDFYNDKAHRYAIDANERLVDQNATIATPHETQGMAVTGGRYIFSRSFGRDNDSTIQVLNGRSIVAPNMSEGIAVARGKLYVVYESGSSYYDDADYRVRTVHHAPLKALL